MVVNHIQDDPQTQLVAGVYQLHKGPGAAIGGMNGKRVDPIIAPVAISRKMGQGHQLNGGYSQILQLRQAGDDGRQSSG